ncbi:unnamed protein product [Penicillium pancosmium]
MASNSTKLSNETVWFVTGCSSGLGKALATTIYNSGHHIVATARNINSLSYLPEDARVLKFALDVTSQESIALVVNSVIQTWNHIDVFINNAGYSLVGDTEAISEADARLQLETLFWGPVHVTKEALRVFREVNPQGQGGTVLQISSMGGWWTAPGHSYYHASKFALEGFTESVAQEMNPEWNIKLMIVAPGGVRTNFAGPNMNIAARHPAYNTPNTVFNQILDYITNPESQVSWSDPNICARLLFDTVVARNERQLPMRLLLGAETIPLIKGDIQKTLAEIDSWAHETVKCSPGGGAVLGS